MDLSCGEINLETAFHFRFSCDHYPLSHCCYCCCCCCYRNVWFRQV